ncbi:Lrp/AsnC family transcriptional regulator [Paenibacillus sp. GSMTC-2017]|uniref:Lrp/AsnC family transcriptional regulator n=1 Tax=Paenibacillus sp. GSMTC-2017 TaxID=2794350 RepID=UPI0018D85276|nr:Lrp/AsnC family transcriptional regulator [Paenibacillus sp. GSMTC-2017]MBH5320469.1 Lrp/AsnC family transcriptional regulator [Paenibacillus sp. GSMTC-2017]
MLDLTDLKIVEELRKNARISMKELGEKVHLTGQATTNRVLKLEENKVIKGYTVLLDQAKIGYPVHSIITVLMKDYNHKPYLLFTETEQQYIVHNFKISGEGCYLLECRFPSNEMLDTFLNKLNLIANYRVSIVINDLTLSEQI